MGFALFMARKMSLKAKINDYNLKLMQIENKETNLANRISNMQQVANTWGTIANMAPQAGSALGLAFGLGAKVLGGAVLGPAGFLAAQAIGSVGGQVAGQLMNGISNMAQQGQQQALAHKQKVLDNEKQRLTTLIQKASAELDSVEKAEGDAIKRSTPKYVG